MTKTSTIGLILLTAVVLASCASPINRANARRYYGAALVAESRGNYDYAKEMYGRSLVNARLGRAPSSNVSAALYGYGRMLGYTCEFQKAEKALLDSLAIERQASPPASANLSARLAELGRLSAARGSLANAANYFDEASSHFEPAGAINADPIGVANFLDYYGATLEQLGRSEKAQTVRARARSLKSANPGRAAGFYAVNYTLLCPNGETAPAKP